jgi:hypothetical protein
LVDVSPEFLRSQCAEFLNDYNSFYLYLFRNNIPEMLCPSKKLTYTPESTNLPKLIPVDRSRKIDARSADDILTFLMANSVVTTRLNRYVTENGLSDRHISILLENEKAEPKSKSSTERSVDLLKGFVTELTRARSSILNAQKKYF